MRSIFAVGMQATLNSTPEPLSEHDTPMQPPHLLEEAEPRKIKIEWADLREHLPKAFKVHFIVSVRIRACD